MSLKAFHIFFIVVSILLSAYFGAWCFRDYQVSDSIGIASLGVFSLVAMVGLTIYLGWFLRKSRPLGYLVFFLTALSSNFASACPVCIGKSDSPLVQAANTGVIFMLVAIGLILTALASLFGYWGYRIHKLSKVQKLPTA